MDFFNFFEQGYFKKLAVENGLNTECFIFQFIVCNLFSIFVIILMNFIKNYAVLIVLIVIVSILFGLILKNKTMSLIKNKEKFLCGLFPLDVPIFKYTMPSYFKLINKNMRWLFHMNVFCLFFICFSIYLINKGENQYIAYFSCYFFGLTYPLINYLILLHREYKRIQF